MALQTIPNDVQVKGNLSAQTLTLPASTVTDAGVNANAGAGNGIKASKLQQQWQKHYSQDEASTVVNAQFPVHIARGATGTVQELRCTMAVANIGAATVVVDLLKNGVSILSAVVTLDSTVGPYNAGEKLGAFSSSAYVVGDVFTIKITATAGGGTVGKGVSVGLATTEDAQ